MLQAMQKLLKPQKKQKNNAKEISGYLTKEDVKKLRSTGTWVSAHRKKTIKTWNCGNCKNSFYYKVIRCPHCESSKITEQINPTQYEFADTEADIMNRLESEQEVIA